LPKGKLLAHSAEVESVAKRMLGECHQRKNNPKPPDCPAPRNITKVVRYFLAELSPLNNTMSMVLEVRSQITEIR
jgi:hypothetical protein